MKKLSTVFVIILAICSLLIAFSVTASAEVQPPAIAAVGISYNALILRLCTSFDRCVFSCEKYRLPSIRAPYVKYVATDSYSGIANCYVKMPGSSYYSAYASGTQLATQGTYSFYSVDRSGNKSTTVTITLDTTKPTGTLYGGTSVVSSGGSTNAAYIKFVPYDSIGLSATYVKKPGASSYVSYTSGTQFTAEGTYLFYSVDKANNISQTYTITLDRQIPTAQLYVDGKPIDNGSYTNGSYISFECDENCFVKVPGSDTFTAYLSGAEYYKEGKYIFYGLSEANNSTG